MCKVPYRIEPRPASHPKKAAPHGRVGSCRNRLCVLCCTVGRWIAVKEGEPATAMGRAGATEGPAVRRPANGLPYAPLRLRSYCASPVTQHNQIPCEFSPGERIADCHTDSDELNALGRNVGQAVRPGQKIHQRSGTFFAS